MNRFEVRETTTIDDNDWDELVAHSSQGTVFHTSDWLKVVSHYMGAKLNFLQCYDVSSNPTELVGGCAYFTHKKSIFNIATDSFYATPYGGVILVPSSNSNQREIEGWQNKIIGSFLNTFKAKRYDKILLFHSPSLIDVRPFVLDGWACNVYYTYILDLKDDFEKKFSKEVKWSIKKAINNKISINKIDVLKPSHIASYENLNKMTFQRQGFAHPFSNSFLTEILTMLYKKEKGSLWFAETDSGEVAAAEIVLYDNKMAHRWSAASHTDYQKTEAVSFLLSEIAKYLKNELKYNEFNLMAATSPPISEFISPFNPRIIPYYSTTKLRKLFDFAYNTIRILL